MGGGKRCGRQDCLLDRGWSIWNQFGTPGRGFFFGPGLDCWLFAGLIAFGVAETRRSVAPAAIFRTFLAAGLESSDGF